MTSEQLFHVSPEGARVAVLTDLADVGFKERDDLQEWVLEHPSILGEDILIITSEFNHWQTAAGERQLNRLDILGLDSEGRLVLGELKRDRAPERVHLQAITYAALVSMFSEDDIVREYHRFRTARGAALTEEDARLQILEHAGELDQETLRNPRIVLVAGDFSDVTTSSVVWLTERGLDITLQQVQAYQISSGEMILTVSQLYPLAAVDDFRISPRRREAQQKREQGGRRREKSTVVRLVHDRLIPDGTELFLEPTNEIREEERQKVRDWLAEYPSQGRARWRNNRSQPLLWEEDGEGYRPTTIVSRVVKAATSMERAFQGPRWWRLADGRSLPEVAMSGSSAAFDWTPLHNILDALPKGRWASYGDIAAIVGTAAQPLGNHLSTCADCSHAWRVLDSRGQSSRNFSWSDQNRTDSQQSALEAEGVRFNDRGQAHPTARLTAEELDRLAAE